jgi:hypothetical protein
VQHHSRSSPLPSVSNFPSASASLKCILEVVFCEGVQHRMRFCFDHLNRVKTAALQSGKHKSLRGQSQMTRVGGGRQSCCFLVKTSLVKKKCKTVRCRAVIASFLVTRVRGEVFAHFHAFVVKRHSSMFGLPGRILYEQSPLCKKK